MKLKSKHKPLLKLFLTKTILACLVGRQDFCACSNRQKNIPFRVKPQLQTPQFHYEKASAFKTNHRQYISIDNNIIQGWKQVNSMSKKYD
jgi:hypothetical protein